MNNSKILYEKTKHLVTDRMKRNTLRVVKYHRIVDQLAMFIDMNCTTIESCVKHIEKLINEDKI